MSLFYLVPDTEKDSKKALTILKLIVDELRNNNIHLFEGHFGSDKELLIHLFGHPGNARYREF